MLGVASGYIITETIYHIVSECKYMAQKEQKKWRHDKVAAIIYWKMCKMYLFERDKIYYEHVAKKAKKVLRNGKVNILWNNLLQTVTTLKHNKRNIILMAEQKNCYMI